MLGVKVQHVLVADANLKHDFRSAAGFDSIHIAQFFVQSGLFCVAVMVQRHDGQRRVIATLPECTALYRSARLLKNELISSSIGEPPFSD